MDRTQSHDENTGDDGDGAITNGLSGAHYTGLPRTHSIPAPSMEEGLSEISSIITTLVPETHYLVLAFTIKEKAEKSVCEKASKEKQTQKKSCRIRIFYLFIYMCMCIYIYI